jgi:predicted peptidase
MTVTASTGESATMRFTVAATGDTAARRPLPLVLSLHYSGPDTLPPHFGASLLERVVLPALAPLGALFVAPDAPDRGWGSPRSERLVLALLDSLAARYPVDARRTLVTGYSLGGMGSWYLASRHPDRFRAAIPMASFPVLMRDNRRDSLVAEVTRFISGPDTAWVAPLRRVPWYVLQSRADETMPFAPMASFSDRLKKLGVDVQLMALDSITHQQTVRFREPLRGALPWIRQQWNRSRR